MRKNKKALIIGGVVTSLLFVAIVILNLILEIKDDPQISIVQEQGAVDIQEIITDPQTILDKYPWEDIPEKPEPIEPPDYEEKEVIQEHFATEEEVYLAQKTILQKYSDELKYPPYSVPLSSEDHSLLKPNFFNALKTPFNYDASSDFSHEIRLSKYRYFEDEPLVITVRTFSNGDKTLPKINWVTGKVFDGGEQIADVTIPALEDKNTGKSQTFYLEHHLSKDPKDLKSPVLTLFVEISLDSENESKVSVNFEYRYSVAHIVGKGSEKVEGAHLLIPINIKTKKPGDYRIVGNLFSATNQDPVSQVSGVNVIKGNSGIITLKVHSSVLKLKNDSGPYVLKDLQVTRLSDSDEVEQYGNAEGKSFTIGKHDLSEYSDEPYVDDDEQQKLDQLKQLLGGN